MKEKEIFQQNEEFVHDMIQSNSDFFNELKEGQHPDFFVIACSDSRVSPSVISKIPLGNSFTHRNIANQVSKDDESFNAGLYYALKHLKVKTIIIEGHTGCGGVAAAWNQNDEPELQGWISKVKNSLPDKEGNEDLSAEELSRQNVLKQVEHLKSHPIYQKYGQGVAILGLLFHLESGKLEKVTEFTS
ncbi:MAG: carbonate dehydratase [Bacillaceae bacterium]|nr:carbonate dehydratase [Bacillaceae bacterium]